MCESVSTKLMVSPTNMVCGVAADEDVSVDVSEVGITVGVGSDASIEE